MMGRHFWDITGLEPFALDQTVTAVPIGEHAAVRIDGFRAALQALGGTGGFRPEERPSGWHQCWADAFPLSSDNEFTED